ncbi:MAG: glycoside hydrolase family 18 protein [bacterium]
MKTKLYFLGFLLAITAIAVTFFSPNSIPFSPLSSSPPTNISHLFSDSFVVMGFAPYWNLKKLTPESLGNITHFTYFHLLLNGDGTIYSKINKREEDPGYTNYKRLLAGTIDHGDKPLILTFMPESQTALSTILSSSASRAHTIETIRATLTESGATGVNIDFEPLGDTPSNVRDNFTLFIQELRTSLTSNVYQLTPMLSISIYPSAAARPRLWNLAGLTPHTDYFVVMTYDYTMPGSNSAGPNSPLRGSGDLFEHDIIKNIAEITKLVPAQKLLLGIPFYGYEWDTVDSSKYSPVEAKGSVASLEHIQKMLEDKTLELIWDRNSLTPYGIASDSGHISQIYFENETSIRLKLEFVKSAGLGGIAIWALGYEGNLPWLWPTIQSLNK